MLAAVDRGAQVRDNQECGGISLLLQQHSGLATLQGPVHYDGSSRRGRAFEFGSEESLWSGWSALRRALGAHNYRMLVPPEACDVLTSNPPILGFELRDLLHPSLLPTELLVPLSHGIQCGRPKPRELML